MKKVMTFGTFDILHPGHIHFFKQAKQYGDFLVVGIARDVIAEKLKKHKLVHNEIERQKVVQELRLVDETMLGDLKDPYKNIKIVKPDVIALGHDQYFFTINLKENLAKLGLHPKIVRLKPYKVDKYKSSKLHDYSK